MEQSQTISEYLVRVQIRISKGLLYYLTVHLYFCAVVRDAVGGA